jgi:hypothetical protein
MAQVRADLAKQHIDVKIRERVEAELKRARIRIESAQTHDDDAPSDGDRRVEVRTQTNDDGK